MKKILPLAIILTLSMQICLGESVTTQAPEVKINANLELTKDTSSVKSTENTKNAQADDTEENIDEYFVDDETENPDSNTTSETNSTAESISGAESPMRLNGYLEYSETGEEPEQEAIKLEPAGTAQVNFSKPKKFGTQSLITDGKKPMFNPIQDNFINASKFSSQEYNIKPISTAYSKKYGQFSFGTSYDSSLDSARASYTTGVFTKYEGKHMALKTMFTKNTQDYDSYSDKIYFIPEFKLTKRLSLLDVMQTDVFQINKSNEVVLRYTPHTSKYADDVQFEVGVGQSFYEDSYLDSSIRFSTRFKL